MNPEWTRTIRTVIQVALPLVASAPLLVPALGLSVTTGVGASIVALAALLTRVMQIPAVAGLLNKYLKIPMPK